MTPFRLTAVLFVLAACAAAVAPNLAAHGSDEPTPREPLVSHLLIMLPPEPSREEQRYTSVCYFLRPQETLHLKVKGEPAIPEGGAILFVGELGVGVEAGALGSSSIHTGGGWSVAFQIPRNLPQEEQLVVRHTGDTAAPACFKLAYEFEPDRAPHPRHKGGNDRSPSPLPSVQPRDPTPRPL